jgi:hypothetical protein
MHHLAPLARLGGLRGLWEYLTAKVNARKEIEKANIALEKDRERNRAVAGYIQQLPEGAELMDYEDKGGRKIWIRMNGPAVTTPAPPAVFLIPGGQIPSTDQEPAGEITP